MTNHQKLLKMDFEKKEKKQNSTREKCRKGAE